MSTSVKAAGIGVALLGVAVGGYALFPHDGGTPTRPPSAVATTPATATPPSERSASPSPTTASPLPRPTSARPPAPAPPWFPAASDRVRLPIADTGQCMDIAPSESAEPYAAACNGSRTQQWELLVDQADQEVRLRNYATGMCLTHTSAQRDGAPVRQERDACRSTATTARWTYFTHGPDEIVFAEKGSTLYFLGLNDWWTAGKGAPHSPAIGTTANYYNTPSLRFRYTGHAFGG